MAVVIFYNANDGAVYKRYNGWNDGCGGKLLYTACLKSIWKMQSFFSNQFFFFNKYYYTALEQII